MTTDRRELVLTRLLEVLAAVPSIQVVVRNRGELPADKRPGIVLLDADEVARPSAPNARGRLIAQAMPNVVDMTPEIYVVMDPRKQPNPSIGTDMNALRLVIIKAVQTDQALTDIVGSNGDIRYAGTQTDMASGRSMEGQMSIRMTFTYPLLPKEL
jgi:hypothetical protein